MWFTINLYTMCINGARGGEHGWDSVLSLPKAQIQSLIGELRTCKIHGSARREKKWLNVTKMRG